MIATWHAAAESLASNLRDVFGDRLRSVVAYGPHVEGDSDAPLTCMALVNSLTVEDLEACARQTSRWERAHVATPLVLPEREFRRSLDAFPLEYSEMMRAHERVYGADPFLDIVIVPEDLRRACETQIKSHLVHLREAFIESGGRPANVASLVKTSAPGFAALLRHVARLDGVLTRDRADATRMGARWAQIPERLIADLLSLEQRSGPQAVDAARLFPEYLAAVEQLAQRVDAWRS